MKIIGLIQQWWFGKKFLNTAEGHAQSLTTKELFDELELIKKKQSKLSHKQRMAVLNRYEKVMKREYKNGK